MAVSRGYILSIPEEREKRYKEFLVNALVEYQKRSYVQTMKLFEEQKDIYENSICQVFQKAEDFLESTIDSRKKGKLRYIHFSYLLSGALSGEHLVKIDFYDKQYYKDVEEANCFWDCMNLFPFYEEACKNAETDIKRGIARIQSGELSRIRIGFTACDYLTLKPVLKELVKGEKFIKSLLPYCEPPVYILYGAYLDEAEILYQIGGNKE